MEDTSYHPVELSEFLGSLAQTCLSQWHLLTAKINTGESRLKNYSETKKSRYETKTCPLSLSLLRSSRMRSERFSFYFGGLGVETRSLDAASATPTIGKRWQPSATVRERSR